MVYETIDARNLTEGLHIPIVYVNDITGGLFINLLLFVIFMVIMFGTYFSAKRSSGEGNFVSSFVVAGFVTSGASMLMMLVPNLIPTYTVIIAFVVLVVGVLWLFFQNVKDK